MEGSLGIPWKSSSPQVLKYQMKKWLRVLQMIFPGSPCFLKRWLRSKSFYKKTWPVFLTFLTKRMQSQRAGLKIFLPGKSFKPTRSGLLFFPPSLRVPLPPPLCSINHSTISKNSLPNTIKETRIKHFVGLGLAIPIHPRRNQSPIRGTTENSEQLCFPRLVAAVTVCIDL